jgi:hypothetical protein
LVTTYFFASISRSITSYNAVSQSYTLNNNELGRSRGFQTEIEEIIRRQKDLETFSPFLSSFNEASISNC